MPSPDASAHAGARRFPSLVLPFAALGATVGYGAVTLLAHPLLDQIRYTPPSRAAVAGGVAAGAVGAILTRVGRRRAAADDAWIRPSRYGVVLVSTLVAGGAAAGVSVSGLGAAGTGAVWGMVCALAALPLAAAVLRAGVRAQRGRLGSIVAAADRRAVWAMCAVATSVVSAASAVGWVTPSWHHAHPPWPGVAAALLSAITLGYLLARDVSAMRRVRAIFARPALLTRDDDATVSPESVERVDLGLGEGVHAELERGASAYRSADRERTIVLGSHQDARSALRRAVGFGVVGLAIAALPLVAHIAARTPDARFASESAMCERAPLWCGATARSAMQRGAAEDQVIALLAQACNASDTWACSFLGAEVGRLDDSGRHVNPSGVLALVLLCQGGDGAACLAVVRHARHEPIEGLASSAVRAMACRDGDSEACAAVAANPLQ